MTARLHRTGPALLGGPGRSAPASGSAGGSARGTAGGSADGAAGGAWAAARRTAAPLAAAAAALAAVLYLAATDPYRPGGHLACPILALTGWYCAGCGAQRAVHSLAHVDLAAAWDMNPLTVLLAPVVVVGWLRWLRRRLRPGPAARRAGRAAVAPAWVLLAAVVTFAVLRNVPSLAPWLAP